jgi:hypothetical protein
LLRVRSLKKPFSIYHGAAPVVVPCRFDRVACHTGDNMTEAIHPRFFLFSKHFYGSGLYSGLLFILVLYCPILSQEESNISHRILLEGFHNAKIGYEINAFGFQAKGLGSFSIIGNDYYSIEGGLFLGKRFRRESNTDFFAILGAEVQYSSEDRPWGPSNWSSVVTPEVGVTMYKYFKNVFIGGAAILELWQIHCFLNNGFRSGWYGIRRFDLNPHFLLGLCL